MAGEEEGFMSTTSTRHTQKPHANTIWKWRAWCFRLCFYSGNLCFFFLFYFLEEYIYYYVIGGNPLDNISGRWWSSCLLVTSLALYPLISSKSLIKKLIN